MIYLQLSNKNIAESVEKIEKFFESANVSHKDKIKICLLIEESLLRYQEKFGEDLNFSLVTKKWFGTPKILIKIKCSPYNPIDDNSEENIFSEQIIKNLLNYEQAGLIYRYENGYNEITAATNKEIKKLKIPGGNITVAIILAIISGLIMQNFPLSTQKILEDEIVAPILQTLFGALISVNIPLIFISIVASICAMEDVTLLNKIGTKILKRFFAMMIFITILSIFVSNLFFPVIDLNFEKNFSVGDSLELKTIFEMILSAVPSNIFEPFISGNILQIVVIAIIFGIAITILGNSVKEFKIWITDLKQIILKIVDIVFKIIPVIIFLCIFKIFLQGSVE